MITFKKAKDIVAINDGSINGWTAEYEYSLNQTSLMIMYEKAGKLMDDSNSKEELVTLVQNKIDEFAEGADGDYQYVALFDFQGWIANNL